jgi:hypothetical protein
MTAGQVAGRRSIAASDVTFGGPEEVGREAWEHLLAAAPEASVFQTWEWTHALPRWAANPVEHRHVVLSSDGRPHAILPAYHVRDDPRVERFRRESGALGAAVPSSMLLAQSLDGFRGGPIAPGEDRGVLGELLRALEREAAELAVPIHGVANVEADRAVLLEALLAAGYLVRTITPTLVLDVEWETWDEYLAWLPKRDRDNVKNLRKRSVAAGLEARIDPRPPDLEGVLELTSRTLLRNGADGDVSRLRELVEGLGDLALHVVVEDAASRLLASLLVLRFRDTLTAVLAGTDPDRSRRTGAYDLAYQELVVHACETGASRVDAGRGVFDFKRKYGFRPLHLLWALKATEEALAPALDRWTEAVAVRRAERFNRYGSSRHRLEPILLDRR